MKCQNTASWVEAIISSLPLTLDFDISECQLKKDKLRLMDKRLLQLGKIIRKHFNDGNEPGCLDLVNGQQADPVFHTNPFSWP